jgi:hypothetical protein
MLPNSTLFPFISNEEPVINPLDSNLVISEAKEADVLVKDPLISVPI